MSKTNTLKKAPEPTARSSLSRGVPGDVPTKHYASSTKMATGGPKNSVEGPCNDNYK
jgi:hypothetical protein